VSADLYLCQITRKEKPLKKQVVIRERLMQEYAMSGMLFWSIGSGVIREGVFLVGRINCFQEVVI
jgi:hypothetical protein